MAKCKDLLRRYKAAIHEMSHVGYKDNFKFYTTGDHGRGRPHIHINHPDFDISVGMPDLTILEIDYNEKPKRYDLKVGRPLPSSLRKILISFLKEEVDEVGFDGNRAQYALITWNMENERYPKQQTTYAKFIGNLLD